MAVHGNEDVQISGAVEHFSWHRVSGWVRLVEMPEARLVSIVCKFKSLELRTLDLTARPDMGNLKCGFAFSLPPVLSSLSPTSLIDEHIGVFAEIEVAGHVLRRSVPFFKDAILAFYQGERSRLPQAKTVCVLIRSHLNSAKAMDLARSLDCLPNVDVFGCLDATNGPVGIGNNRSISHTTHSLAKVGLWTATLPRGLFYFGDMPFYDAMFTLPDYDFYLMIEYDVHLTHMGLEWLSVLIEVCRDPRRSPDLFAPYIFRSTASWYWDAHARSLYDGDIYGCVFPIIGLSKSAVAHLYSARLREAAHAFELGRSALVGKPSNGLAYCEFFVPTTLHQCGLFKIETATTLGLDWTKAIKEDFHISLPILHGTPRSDFSAIQHPVLDWPQFVSKLKNFLSSAETRSDEEWRFVVRYLSQLTEEQRLEPLVAKSLLLGASRA